MLARAPTVVSWQDVAVALGAKDPLSVPDGVRRLVAVIKAVPRLQSFVSDVCKVGMAGVFKACAQHQFRLRPCQQRLGSR